MGRAWQDGALPVLSASLNLKIGSKWPEIGQPKERFDPDEISARVGLSPTATGRLGDLIVPGFKARRRTDSWWLRAGPDEALDVNKVLADLRALLEPSWDQLKEACAADDLLACVFCVVELKSTLTPAIWITAPTLRWITELGADLDIDIAAHALGLETEEPSHG